MTPRTMVRRAGAAAALSWHAAPAATTITALLTTVTGALPVIAAWSVKVLLDELTRGQAANPARVVAAIAVISLTGVVGAAAQQLGGYLDGVLRRALHLAVQQRLFARINEYEGLAPFEDPAFLNRLRLAEDAGQRAPDEVVTAAVTGLRSAVQAAGFLATLLLVWPPMVALVLAVAVPAVVLQLKASRRRAALAEDLSPRMRRQIFYRDLLTDIRAAKEIRLFGLGNFLHGRMLDELRHADEAEGRLDRRIRLIELALELFGAALAAAGFAVAGYQALHGRLSIGDVSVFFAAVGGVTTAVSSVVGGLATAYGSLLLFGNYLQVVNDPDLAPSSPDRPVGAPVGGIEFRDVWFRYGDDQPWVLRGVTFTIPCHATVGLVGVNGAGKTTIVKLLCRLYRPQRGSIHWDGVDIAELPAVALRERISAVFQDFMAYDLTAADNIGLGFLPARNDLDRIRHAARLACVDADLVALPRGYRTMLSRIFPSDDDRDDPTSSLSGGQWQRVALARAFLRTEADLLVLDEPSSGLDADAEYALHLRLRTLRTGRTSLLISHRLAALRDADLILVVDRGRIVEQGQHAELIEVQGTYARLFRLQSRGYLDVNRPVSPALPLVAS